MITKNCPGCFKDYSVRDSQRAKIFCSLLCVKDAMLYTDLEKQYLLKEKENACIEYEVIEMKRELLVMRESVGYGYK